MGSATTEVGMGSDRDALDEIKTLLQRRRDVTEDHARTTMGITLEHAERIGAIEAAMVDLRKDLVSGRAETNAALNKMSGQLGELRGMKWYERALMMWAYLSAGLVGVSALVIAVVVVLRFWMERTGQ